MKHICVLCLLLLIAQFSFAMAETPFDRAKSLWLQGDDARSLPLLADLARNRDMRARVLLSRIEIADKGPSPFRMSLPRTQAQALFRNMQARGPFGRSWLKTEADAGNDLAQALLASRLPQPDMSLIKKLVQLGEYEATDHPTRIMALYGSTEERKALNQSGYLLPDLEPYLAYLSDPPEPRADGLAALRHIAGGEPAAVRAEDSETLGMAGILALGFGYGDLNPANRWRPVVENWLLSAPSTQPIADLCQAGCPDEAAACAFAFLALSGGYYEVIRLDTPSETYIPQAEFLASPRARIMTLRRVALARAETNLGPLASTDEIATLSHCAAQMIEETRTSYR